MDLDRLQGTWHSGPASITIEGNRFTASQMGAGYTGTFVVDGPSLTLHFATGPEAGNVNYGIHSLTGDEWRICLNMTGGPAPSEFQSAPGVALIVYHRAQPAEPAGAARPSAPGQPVAALQGEWSMVRCVRAGEPLPAAFAKHGVRRVKGTSSTLHFGPQLFMQGTLTEDGPGTFRLEPSTGEGPQFGIYTVSGAKLETCTSASGKPRPASYASTTEGGETYTEWKRR